MPNTRDIQRRIRGVKNTGKITRAMEMISAVKMRKATQKVVAIRPYAEQSLAVLQQLVNALRYDETHPLLDVRPVQKELYIVVSSNRGLCGAFNTQIFKRFKQLIASDDQRQVVCIALGKKAEHALRRMDQEILASFPEVIQEASVDEVRVVAKMALDEFCAGRVDRVSVLSMDYISVMSQEVGVRTLLPVAIDQTEEELASMRDQQTLPTATSEANEITRAQSEYIIEPTPKVVLEAIVPKLITMELYHMVLESKASEESARMMAMRGATDASKEMAADLTLTYNQLRQQKITQEIAELSAGMAAVSK